jgi:3-isopropylmalate/(R)-2-methylmalate dehydratase large subunit
VAPVDEVRGIHVDQVYMGNCANGTLTDLRQIASILKGRKVARGTRAIIVPATQKIYRQALAEGLIDQFVEAGAAVTTPTCGACFGGHNGALADGEVGLATINRNFTGRAGHAGAKVYLSNSYVAAAAAVAGEIVDPAKL